MSPHRVRLTLYAVSLIESILLLLSFRLILRIKPLLGKVYIMHGDNSEGEVAVTTEYCTRYVNKNVQDVQ